MNRLIIFVSLILIASASIVFSGCQGGQIEGGLGIDTTQGRGEVADIADVSGGSAAAAGSGKCDPADITSEIIKEDKSVEQEGETCLMSRVPMGGIDGVSVVFSVDRSAQQIISAMAANLPQNTEEEAKKAQDFQQQFMTPFDQLDLEELVGFGKLKFVDGIKENLDDQCRKCMDESIPNCLADATAECNARQTPPNDMDKCILEVAASVGVIQQCADWTDKCYDSCKEQKAEPEYFGVLVRWLPRDDDPDGSVKLTDLENFVMDLNKRNLEDEVLKWHQRCDQDPVKCNGDGYFLPTELKPEEKMEIELVDATVALAHSAAARPNIIEPVSICSFIRFDGIRTRPAVYGELLDMKLIMKIKPGEVFTEATRDSSKLVLGIDSRDNKIYANAGVIDKQTLETGAHVSFVDNLAGGFGLELWKQMVMGLANKK